MFASLLSDRISQPRISRRASREHFLQCAFSAMRSRALNDVKMEGVPIFSTMDKARLERIADCASKALRVIKSKTVTEDPWYGVVPHLLATARGMTVSPFPLSSLFNTFVSAWATSSAHAVNFTS